ncbi:hypothetical protein CH92_15025 [Stutzerimonas stutzeri]|uniref:SCP domain-containing protein n=1 Tax=Stutzerimonas stutzeri TaxID=316 RepID=W8R0B2_STUST|nr:CAP domain-containing protein [Stutzerimonas stutzeri]AHL76330.1 hypothetical protein CH92_15025 [Stutzerimonas stutzeri]MCQ4329562.1 CAP domain-containing protein [Stutzerimonas stutzeri]
MDLRNLAFWSITARTPLRRVMVGSTVLAAMLANGANADETDELVSLVNEFRASGEGCGGGKGEQVGPLAPAAALASIPAGAGAQIQQAVRDSGYQAASLQAMAVTGPGDANTVMRVFKQRYCSALVNDEFAEIGVSHEGNTWQVILAKPLLSADLGDWQQAGKAVLEQVNRARAEPRRCGSQRFDAAPPLTWNQQLGETSLAHSQDMAKRDYFSHQGHDQSLAGDRARRQGYHWQRIGENIAAGHGSAEQAVSGWLASPGHCQNIMNPGFTEMGAAYATNPQSAATIYWTQVFGTPR